jgi:hypothetical protein
MPFLFMAGKTPINNFEVIYSSNTFFPRIAIKNSGKIIGQLIFHPNGAGLPPDGIVDGQVNLHYHLDDFANALNLLRSEKTIFMLFAGSGPAFENALVTVEDPVGQGEKVAV